MNLTNKITMHVIEAVTIQRDRDGREFYECTVDNGWLTGIYPENCTPAPKKGDILIDMRPGYRYIIRSECIYDPDKVE